MSAVESFGNVKSDAGLAKLNAHMYLNSFVEGCCLSAADVRTFKAMNVPHKQKYPFAYRWHKHVASVPSFERDALCFEPVSAMSKPASAQQKAAPADDDDDLFGDSAPVVDLKAAMKAKQAEAKAEKKKPAPAGKSTVTLEVRPQDTGVNLDDLARRIQEIEINGLTWTQTWQTKDVAYGLKALVIGCVIIDELVPLETVTRSIQSIGLGPDKEKELNDALDQGLEFEEEDLLIVRNVNVLSFSKL